MREERVRDRDREGRCRAGGGAQGSGVPGAASAGRQDGQAGQRQRDQSYGGPASVPGDTFSYALLILAVVALLMLTGCGLTDAHHAADRRFFEAAAPELQGYWSNDARLGKHEVERRERFLRTWKLFIESGDPKAQPKGDEELPAPKDGGPW